MHAMQLTRQVLGLVGAGSISLLVAIAAVNSAAATTTSVPAFRTLDGGGAAPSLRVGQPVPGTPDGPDSYLRGRIGFTSIES
jgi:hypothetical protein